MLTVGVLGPLRVLDADLVDITPSGALQRRLLSVLLLHAPRPVSIDRLAEALWPEQLPSNHVAAVQTHVFRVRKLVRGLEIDFEHGGYRTAFDDATIDVDVLERHLGEASRLRTSEPDLALRLLDEALALWRGEPWLELLDDELAAIERARLVELRLRCHDERFELLLDHGRGREAIPDLEALTVAHPTRERPHTQLMRALADSGRTVDGLRVYDRLRQALSAELGIEPSLEVRRFHDRLVVGFESEDHTHRAEAPLARPTTTLFGRRREVADTTQLLTQRRLVTLVGTGGVGKTRIALEVAHNADRTVYPHGVWWCDLAPSTSSTVIEAIANALEIELGQPGGHATRIASVLRHVRALIVLDNCEHVLDAVAPLAEELLVGCPGIHTLCTSRERLAVEGEQLLQVDPLGAGYSDAPAVELFVDRALAAQSTLRIDAASLAEIGALCERLGGLPLAIELAAARLHTMSVAEIANEIDNGIAVLAGQRRRVDRQRSLSATLRWSTELLEPSARDGLSALAVFRSAFGVDSAAAVLGVEEDLVRAVLTSLVERSLVHRDGSGYVLLEPIRQFAREEMRQDPIAAARRADRHAAHFVDVAERLDRALLGPDSGLVKQQFDAVLPDLRAARQRLVVNADAERIFRLANAVKRYGVNYLRSELLLWGTEAVDIRPDDPRAVDMLALAATCAWARGDRAGFIEATEVARSHNAARRDTIPSELADILGLMALATGNMTDSIDWYRRALATLGDADELRWVELQMTLVLASAYSDAADTNALADELLTSIGSPPDGLLAAWAWYGAGEAMIGRNDELAERRLRNSVELARRIDCSFIAGIAGASVASLVTRRNGIDEARDLYRWLLPLWVRTGDKAVAWTAMRSIVELLIALDRPDEAATLLAAVRTTDEGHTIFGADRQRLDDAERHVREVLGEQRYHVASRAGERLDVADATELILRTFGSDEATAR